MSSPLRRNEMDWVRGNVSFLSSLLITCSDVLTTEEFTVVTRLYV
jgi:hypothetical protein